MFKANCGSSSAGRARPCQGRGRGFESRLSLKKWHGPQTVLNFSGCPGGGTGRHAGLKILWAAMFVRVQVPPRVQGSEVSEPFFILRSTT